MQLTFNFELIEFLENIESKSAIIVGKTIMVIGRKIKRWIYGIGIIGITARQIKKAYSVAKNAIGVFGDLLLYLNKSLYKMLLKGF